MGVFLGPDVGKQAHHGHGLTPVGKTVFDKPLPNGEPKLRAVFGKLRAKFGTVLVVVDQPASIGALPLTVARDTGCKVAYLPGLAMRGIADLYPGEAKTDAKDAAVIADAARIMPHTLRTLDLADEVTAELTMLVGFDQDLAGEADRTSNRIRVLLTPFHLSLERVLGPRPDHQAVTWLLERYGSPQALRKAGRRRLGEVVRPRTPRMAERLVDDTFAALDEQTVTVPAGWTSTSGQRASSRRLPYYRPSAVPAHRTNEHPQPTGTPHTARHKGRAPRRCYGRSSSREISRDVL
ncbi:Transposase [Streptomyces aidingensis]|uniref:Transposase n=1 Tax=Streptomyces aidingensis TaxID=910347 RepID=A0A1I1QPC7_9ACTN|nr:Transposase [Streptomyces aidingensis]